jgi:hypothetical protein
MRYQLPEELRELTGRQQGILTSDQARVGGLSRDIVRSRLRQERWQRIHAGVYATFTGPLSRPAVIWAAVLRAGPGAVLSYATAAELDGLADEPSVPIHITIPASRRIAPISGAMLHISARTAAARHPVAAPPRTRIQETVLDLAGAAVLLDDACAWVTCALGRGLTTPDRLRSAMAQRSRMRWRAELTELLSDDMAGVRSALEYRYVRSVEQPHALPRGSRQARARPGNHTEYRDVLYEAYGVAIELDGRAAHPGELRWRDQRRDNRAAADGILTLRYGWLDVRRRPCQTAAQVTQVLRQRGFRGGQACSPSCPVPRPGR